MNTPLYLSMASFALAASISPGPVNLVTLSLGSQRILGRGLSFVSGATLGFIALFVATGYGLHSLLERLPVLEMALRWAGIAFLLYLAWLLLTSDGEIAPSQPESAPGFLTGALMQWLNPKAWLASASGIGAYTAQGDSEFIWIFAAIYLPICWLSVSCWLLAGLCLQRYVQRPSLLRWFNRILSVLLAASCLGLLL